MYDVCPSRGVAHTSPDENKKLQGSSMTEMPIKDPRTIPVLDLLGGPLTGF